MPELKPDVTAEAIEALEGMAETWFEKNGSVRKAIMAVPLNCQNVEHAKEARELIRRLVRDTYMEGLYNGRISHAIRPDGGDSPAPTMREKVAHIFMMTTKDLEVFGIERLKNRMRDYPGLYPLLADAAIEAALAAKDGE